MDIALHESVENIFQYFMDVILVYSMNSSRMIFPTSSDIFSVHKTNCAIKI